MIHVIRSNATQEQIEQMLEELDPIIKLAVDINREILAGGGQMHADCEAVLLEDGSHQEDIWGANWIPASRTIEFEALINIRPGQQNLSMTIQNPMIKSKVEKITRELLENV
ncbi:DUF5674 family protein [candidate division KSB1 bacterium]